MDIRFVLPARDERITRLVWFLYGRQFRVLRWIGVVSLGAAVVLVALMALTGVHAADVFVAVVAVAAAAVLLAYPALAVRRVRRTQPYAGASWSYRLTDDGVAVTGAPATQNFAWDGFQRADETAGDVFLLITPNFAVQLPKDLLGEADLAELRAFLVGRGLLVGAR
ncbi:MAG TPA: YcxB family protein [Actinocatenispora sp.]